MAVRVHLIPVGAGGGGAAGTNTPPTIQLRRNEP